jgi:hypothetical protein
LELNNPHIGLLERSMPVEFKHDVIRIDLNEALREETPAQAKQAQAKQAQKPKKQGKEESGEEEVQAQAEQVQEEAQAEQVQEEEEESYVQAKEEQVQPQQTDAFTTLLEQMRQNYLLASVPNKPKRGEDNWYKFCSEVMNEMETLGLPRARVLDALLNHICDDLRYEDKLVLLTGVVQKDFTPDEFSAKIKEILLKNAVSNKGVTGVYVQHKNDPQLLIRKDMQWVPAEAEDIYDLAKPIAALKTQFLPAKTKLNSVVGFMANFKKEENNIVFKLKVFELNGVKKKRNKGARCYGKSTEMLLEILGEDMYKAYLALIQTKYKEIIEEKKKNRQLHNVVESAAPDELEAINHTHACVIQEMFLRTYNLDRKGDRVWFLTPEEALLIDIENLSY